jgi:hypothetical protein
MQWVAVVYLLVVITSLFVTVLPRPSLCDYEGYSLCFTIKPWFLF